MKPLKATILVCEGDASLNSVLVDYLRSKEYIVVSALSGEEGIATLMAGGIDLCLIDTNTSNKSGLEMVKEMRESGMRTPVIMTSEHSDKANILEGYQAGCDDYVIKPYVMDILICKIEALLRLSRFDEQSVATEFQLGELHFDSVRQTLGEQHLSTRENDLLLMLCQSMNKMVDRSHILKNIWRVDDYFAARSLSVYVHHLRTYLASVPNIRILSVHGKGYKMVNDDKEEE